MPHVLASMIGCVVVVALGSCGPKAWEVEWRKRYDATKGSNCTDCWACYYYQPLDSEDVRTHCVLGMPTCAEARSASASTQRGTTECKRAETAYCDAPLTSVIPNKRSCWTDDEQCQRGKADGGRCRLVTEMELESATAPSTGDPKTPGPPHADLACHSAAINVSRLLAGNVPVASEKRDTLLEHAHAAILEPCAAEKIPEKLLTCLTKTARLDYCATVAERPEDWAVVTASLRAHGFTQRPTP